MLEAMEIMFMISNRPNVDSVTVKWTDNKNTRPETGNTQ